MKIKKKHIFIFIIISVIVSLFIGLLFILDNPSQTDKEIADKPNNICIDDTVLFNGISDKYVMEAIEKDEIYEQYSFIDEKTNKECRSYYIHDLQEKPLLKYTNGFMEIITTTDSKNTPYIKTMRYYYTLTINKDDFYKTILDDIKTIYGSLKQEDENQKKRIYYFLHTDENGIYSIDEFNEEVINELLKKQEMNRLYVMIEDGEMYDIFTTFRVAENGGYEIIAEYSRKL